MTDAVEQFASRTRSLALASARIAHSDRPKTCLVGNCDGSTAFVMPGDPYPELALQEECKVAFCSVDMTVATAVWENQDPVEVPRVRAISDHDLEAILDGLHQNRAQVIAQQLPPTGRMGSPVDPAEVEENIRHPFTGMGSPKGIECYKTRRVCTSAIDPVHKPAIAPRAVATATTLNK